MIKYMPFIEINEDYNPSNTFKMYVINNFTKDEIVDNFKNIIKEYVSRIVDECSSVEDFIKSLHVYIADYDPNDPFIVFLQAIINNKISNYSNLPSKLEDLSEGGQEIYRVLQLIGEDVFYELLVRELDKVENVNQSNDNSGNVLDGMYKRKAQNFIYKNCVPVTSGLFNDEGWGGINAFFEKLNDFGIDWEMTNNPKYFNFPYDPQIHDFLPYKEYYFKINFINDKNKPTELRGTIRGNGAGSVEDPLDRYDVTVVVG